MIKEVAFLFKVIKNNIMIIIAIPLVIGFFLFIKNSNAKKVFEDKDHIQQLDTKEDSIIEENELFKEDNVLIVDIKGEVNRPGIYQLNHGDRVNDLIIEAGGFLTSADDTQVNLAQKLQDEMIVFVPPKGEAGGIEEQSVINSSQDQSVKVNYATEAELTTLPGIGPSKAQAIINYRDEHGFFSQNEDLLNISGIGEKTLENLLDHIQIP